METEKEYRQSVESGRERRFDSKAGEQIFESHYIDGKKEGEEWEIFEDGRTLHNRTTRHYRNGKLDGSYHVESTRDGKPYITIEGQYTTARNRDVGNSTTPPMTQPMNGMNDFLFSQVDFIKLPPKVRTFGKRCYICN